MSTENSIQITPRKGMTVTVTYFRNGKKMSVKDETIEKVTKVSIMVSNGESYDRRLVTGNTYEQRSNDISMYHSTITIS